MTHGRKHMNDRDRCVTAGTASRKSSIRTGQTSMRSAPFRVRTSGWLPRQLTPTSLVARRVHGRAVRVCDDPGGRARSGAGRVQAPRGATRRATSGFSIRRMSSEVHGFPRFGHGWRKASRKRNEARSSTAKKPLPGPGNAPPRRDGAHRNEPGLRPHPARRDRSGRYPGHGSRRFKPSPAPPRAPPPAGSRPRRYGAGSATAAG